MNAKKLDNHSFVKNFNHHTQPYDTFAVGKPLGFSWWNCDSCGASHGGNRTEIRLINSSEPLDTVTVSSCDDCVAYVANGDLPDGT